MKAALKRWLIATKDRIRYSSALQCLAGFALTLRGVFTRPLAAKLDLYAKAVRLLVPRDRAGWITARLSPYVEDAERVEIWRRSHVVSGSDGSSLDEFEISKGLLLKPYRGPKEKGVLMISFEYNWLPLLSLSRRDTLFDRYALICAPSWSPPPFPAIWSMAGLKNADVFVMQSNFREADWYNRLPTNVSPLPLLISHWIHPDFYQPQPFEEREIDILMVANWAVFKRQWVLFRALQELPRDFRVVLVGQPDSGRTMAHIEAEAEAFGVRDRIEIRERLGIDEVTALQCRSKTSLVFSRREGSCVVVAESMFADCPVGLLQGAHIGSSAFVNEHTGVMLNESNLARELQDFVERAGSFSAREWAMKNISCFRSAELMNRHLREWNEARGNVWTQDVLPFMCRPNPMYVAPDAEAQMAAAYQDLRSECGVSVRGHT